MEKGSLPMLEQLEAARVAATLRERESCDVKSKFAQLMGTSKQTKSLGETKSKKLNRLKREVEELKEQRDELLDITDSFDYERIGFCQQKRELLQRMANQEEILDEQEDMLERLERESRGVKWGWLGMGCLVGIVGSFILGK